MAGMKNQKRRKKSTGKSHKKITGVQRKRRVRQNIRAGFILLAVLFLVCGAVRFFHPSLFRKDYCEKEGEKIDAYKPEIDVELLTVNPYSRPGIKTDKIAGVVIHYTANPGATAIANRNYFEGLKDSHETKTSSNFVIGLEGEIVQCVPTWEVAYASNGRNSDTVSIECCHPDESGKFTKETYHSMVELTTWLLMKFGLNEKDVIRHYDVTGKNCPRYFVENEEAWEQFREDVKSALEKAEK